MANAREIGKINEGIILSKSDHDSSVYLNKEKSFTRPTRKSTVAPPPDDSKDDGCKKESANFYCRFVVSHTKLAFAISFGAHVLLLALTAILTIFGYDVMNLQFGRLPLEIPDDSTKLRSDAWYFAKDDISTKSKGIKQLLRSVQYQPIKMVYEAIDGNVFLKEHLQAIKKSEEEIFGLKNYQTKLCQLQGLSTNMTCKKPLSIIRFFDGSYRNIHPGLFGPDFENISSVLFIAQSINLTKAILNFHLSKDAVIAKNISKSKYTRSLIYTGWPLSGYSNTNDDKEDQQEKMDELIIDEFSSTFEKKHKEGVGNMNFYYNNLALRRDAIQKQAIYDMMLAIASLVFILIFSWFHTGSVWLTLWGIFSIVSSFNITNLIYRFIFDYRYFGMFHVLSIFIILGIGCDDVFIFMDTWKQSGDGSFKSLAHRLSKVFNTAAKTTFITSFTTMAAFLSNMQSPLLAIYSFGLFSAILIIVNYLSIIVFFPVVLVLHHTSRKGKCCCVLVQRKKENKKSKKISKYLIEFFEGWFFRNIITHKVHRWIVVVFFLILAAMSVFYATKLEANKEQIKIWRSGSNWNIVRDLESNAFRKSQEDRVIIVHVIWGLKEQDRSECHHTDFECKGKTVLDQDFDLNPLNCQQAILDFCKDMKNVNKEDEEKLRLRRSQVTRDVEIECIFERMNEFLEEKSNTISQINMTLNSTSTNFALPLNEEKITTLLRNYPNVYKPPLPKNISRFFEVGAGFFMIQGGKKNYASSFDYKRYDDLIEGVTYPHSLRNVSQVTKEHNRIVYVAIALNTTVNPSTLGYEEGLKIYENWETFVSRKMSKLSPECNKGFQTTVKPFNVWQWLKVQKLLVRNALTGIVIGLILSLVVLTIATTNVIIGVMATLTIAMVTCGVLAMISIVGWSLGVLESLNITLIVGLAVDYVVHLAEGYMVNEEQDRVTRVKYTLGHVGISVFSGACTTLGSSIFLLAAQIIFFSQFGIFIFCTIGLSILYSLFFFTTVLALIGPEGNTGSLKHLMRRIKKCICCKDEDVVYQNSRNSIPDGDKRNGFVVVTKL